MPHHTSSKTTKKTVRFVDSPYDTYSYGSDYTFSPVVTCSSLGKSQRLPTSRHHHSRSLNGTPLPSFSPNFSSPEYSPYSLLTSRTVPPSLSSLRIPSTPDGLRHPITLLPVKENSLEASTTIQFHESLRPPRLSIDLSQDISPYILTLRDKPDMSFPMDMILISSFLPWRIHISRSSVRDVVVALYMALRTRVTDQEMKEVGGEDVAKAFAKRVERAGEEEKRKGFRRVDFLLGYTRLVGIEPMDEPGVWTPCFLPP